MSGTAAYEVYNIYLVLCRQVLTCFPIEVLKALEASLRRVRNAEVNKGEESQTSKMKIAGAPHRISVRLLSRSVRIYHTSYEV